MWQLFRIFLKIRTKITLRDLKIDQKIDFTTKFFLRNLQNFSNPVDTRRRFNVYRTAIRRLRRRIDVLQTLKRRRVSAGKSQTCIGLLKVLSNIYYRINRG